MATRRLTLRAPTLDDVDFHHRLHTDPRLFGHTPADGGPERSRAALSGWMQHWATERFGYAVVVDEHGESVGVAGLQRGGDHLNLYYRFGVEAQGQGLAREAVRAVLAWSAEHLPGVPVRAVIRVRNTASVRTAEMCGLLCTAEIDPRASHTRDGSSMATWRSPTIAAVDGVDAGLRDRVLDLWRDVVYAGGAVGFRASAGREEISPVLDAALDDARGGRAKLVTMTAPDGALLGFGFWRRKPDPLHAHVLTLDHLQVTPAHRHLGLGRMLLAGMHGIARATPGVEVLKLGYRSGTGLGPFFAGSGYAEVGHLPGVLRVADGDDRDDVLMMRRVAGGLPRRDGRD